MSLGVLCFQGAVGEGEGGGSGERLVAIAAVLLLHHLSVVHL